MTYSEVKAREVEQPTIGVPSPACDRTVNDCCPAESEDHRWHDASALERSTDDQLHCAGAEEHLIQAEDNLGEEGRARRGSRHDILQTEVVQVTDEGTGSTGVRERVAPEHPLEANTWQISMKLSWMVHISLTLPRLPETGTEETTQTCDEQDRHIGRRYRG